MFQLAKLFGSFGVSFRLPDNTESDIERMELLTSLFDPKKMAGKQRLVLGNVKTVEEVAWIRKQGGYVCHMKGRPSNVIRMLQGDFYITADAQSSGQYLDVQECFSRLLLAYKKNAQQRRRH
ncbi:MAG: hypothetical protein K2W88_00100 [Pararheinheimera sp.]|nr:hypothetical protein [Rheinheimera sp.]